MRTLLAVVLVACVMVFSPTQVGATTDGLAYSEDTVFTVLEGSVRVETTAVMSNTTTERRSGNTIYYSYFDAFQFVIPDEATDVSVTSRGTRLSTTEQDLDQDFVLLSATLPSQLRSGQSRTVEISFLLPHGDPREEGLFFSNPAFHSFPIWSFSDPGTGSLRLRVPQDAEMAQFGGELHEVGVEDGYVVWEPRDFADPGQVFAFVTVTVDGELRTESFSVSGQDIVLRTWPGDVEWATFARDTIENGLPTLESLIGLPIPDQESLEITESVSPYFYGYAGWYDPGETTIEVGSELDAATMLHELSHAWFNDSLFDERWINEGLAEEFTWHAQRTLEWPTEVPPSTPRALDAGAIPLVEWGSLDSRLGDETFRDQEEYGYNASWYAVHRLFDLVGVDGMRQVIAAADADITTYRGDDVEETTAMPDDWRRVLDLVSEEAGVEREREVEQIFTDFVLGEHVLEELEHRRQARATYQTLLTSEPTWRIPDEIRSAMTEWEFAEAEQLMSDARDVLVRYDDVLNRSASQGLSLSDASRRAYESDSPDLAAALDILEEQAAALPEVLLIRDTIARPLTTNQRWGLSELDLSPLVVQAEVAFGNDDFARIAEARRVLDQTLVDAEQLGSERILWTKIGSGAAGLFTIMGSFVVARRRRRHSTVAFDLIQDDVVLSV